MAQKNEQISALIERMREQDEKYIYIKQDAVEGETVRYSVGVYFDYEGWYNPQIDYSTGEQTVLIYTDMGRADYADGNVDDYKELIRNLKETHRPYKEYDLNVYKHSGYSLSVGARAPFMDNWDTTETRMVVLDADDNFNVRVLVRKMDAYWNGAIYYTKCETLGKTYGDWYEDRDSIEENGISYDGWNREYNASQPLVDMLTNIIDKYGYDNLVISGEEYASK